MDYIALLEYALKRQASDVHLVPGAVPMIRKNGKLYNVDDLEAFDYAQIEAILDEILETTQRDKLDEKGALSFSYSIHHLGRFRVNIISQRGTYSVTFRILHLSIPEIESLGVPEAFSSLIEHQKGLILVSGSSGSGKSTTIASLIQKINQTRRCHIITVEEPIEYLFRHQNAIITQRDVGTDCSCMYEGVLAAMRHDPDVLMISDLTDDRVVDLALQAAESGKLVICGIRANNARSTIEKMVASTSTEKMESRKYKLTAMLLGILSQQLVPDLNEEVQLPVFELLLPNAAIKSHIVNDQLRDIVQALIAGRKHGMSNMDNSLFELYKDGKIKRATVFKYAHDIDFVNRLELTYNRE